MTTNSETATPYGTRNVVIDILRALIMLLMIFVNELWSVIDVPRWMLHTSAMEDGMGLSDIVFPCFLIIVGMSIPYALEVRRARGYGDLGTVGHIISRSVALVVMGVFTVNVGEWGYSVTGMSRTCYSMLMVVGFLLVWNTYPRTDNADRRRLYTVLKLAGAVLLVFLAVTYRGRDGMLFHSSWWGILGIIGWTYLFCAMVYMFTRDRLSRLVPLWVALATVCTLLSVRQGGDGATLLELSSPNLLEQALEVLHLGNCCSAALTCSGMILSVCIVRYRNRGHGRFAACALVCAALALLAGLMANRYLITSKIMATTPWLMYNIAIMLVLYVLVAWAVDAGYARWFDIVKPAGVATLTCYVMPYITGGVITLTGMQTPQWMHVGVVGLLDCLVYSLAVIWLTWLVGRLNIKLKV